MQSRYYDPEVGRFISMDAVEYIAPNVVNGLNLYAYCVNNPVMGYDPKGTIWPLIIVGGLLFGMAMTLSSCSKPEEPESTITSEDVNINGANSGGYIQVEIKENNIRIVDSYKITEKKDQERVIDIIMDSNAYKQYDFSRTKDSYVIEWRAHNIAYSDPLGIVSKKGGQSAVDRAASVDLNEDWENDEFYSYYWLGRIL